MSKVENWVVSPCPFCSLWWWRRSSWPSSERFPRTARSRNDRGSPRPVRPCPWPRRRTTLRPSPWSFRRPHSWRRLPWRWMLLWLRKALCWSENTTSNHEKSTTKPYSMNGCNLRVFEGSRGFKSFKTRFNLKDNWCYGGKQWVLYTFQTDATPAAAYPQKD